MFPASTFSACRGSTRAARHCLAGSRTTLSSSRPRLMPPHRRTPQPLLTVRKPLLHTLHTQRHNRKAELMNDHSHEHDARADEHFSTAVAGLPKSVGTEVLDLGDGETFDLRIAPVTKRIGDATVRMLAYNGSIPGPTLRVREGSQLVVEVTNEADLPATVHWHGLRLDNRYDGTHETQAPIPVGGAFTYSDRVPRSRRLLVPPAHPGGLRPGNGPLREHPRRPRRSRLLASRAPRDPR